MQTTFIVLVFLCAMFLCFVEPDRGFALLAVAWLMSIDAKLGRMLEKDAEK